MVNHTLVTLNGVWLWWMGIPWAPWAAAPIQIIITAHLAEYNRRFVSKHKSVLFDHRARELDGYRAAIAAHEEFPDAIAWANCGWDDACVGVAPIATVYRHPLIEGAATIPRVLHHPSPPSNFPTMPRPPPQSLPPPAPCRQVSPGKRS